MKRRATPAILAATAVLGMSAMTCSAQAKAPAFDPRDFSGTWDHYPAPGEATGAPKVPPNIPVPTACPGSAAEAPVHVQAWKAERKKYADATAAGEPIATGYTHCQPDGMPAMMMAMFPMEVLQTQAPDHHHPGSLQPGAAHLSQ